MSEMKIGRYWTKEQRKRHLEQAREHKRQKERLLRQLAEKRAAMVAMMSSSTDATIKAEDNEDRSELESVTTNEEPRTLDKATAEAQCCRVVNRLHVETSTRNESSPRSDRHPREHRSPVVVAATSTSPATDGVRRVRHVHGAYARHQKKISTDTGYADTARRPVLSPGGRILLRKPPIFVGRVNAKGNPSYFVSGSSTHSGSGLLCVTTV